MKWQVIIMAVLAFGLTKAAARMNQDITLDADAGARITVSSCFDVLPTTGFAPIDVTINNHSGQTRRWTFTFCSPAFVYGNSSQMISTFTLAVENNSTRAFPLYVPTGTSSNRYGAPWFQVSVSGHGARELPQMFGGHSSSGKTPTPFVAISASLGTSMWSSLSSQMQSHGNDLNGSTFKPEELPEDWRGFTGVTALWLSGEEWNALNPAQRNAVETWVHMGGQFMLCGVTTVPPEFRYPGLGKVQLLGRTLSQGQTEQTIKALKPALDSINMALGSSEMVKPNVPLLGSFMGLFALVVGPLNIFVLARKRRERLFWTTPFLSLGASRLLMLVIMMQDGSGGHGKRGAVVYIFPKRHDAVIVQAQTSRTGLLLKSTFQIADPVWVDMLDLPWEKNQERPTEIDGATYSRNWFSSRTTQAQRIVGVIPTRAEITLVNAGDVAGGAAPVIVSSFETLLKTVYYTDDQSRAWMAHDVRTGDKATLTPLERPLQPSELPHGLIHGSLPRMLEPGTFWAIADKSPHYIGTLSSIRWNDDPVTYIGPIIKP